MKKLKFHRSVALEGDLQLSGVDVLELASVVEAVDIELVRGFFSFCAGGIED